MNERHILQYSHPVDFEVGRPVPSHLHPEPYVLFGGTPSFPHPSGDFEHRNLPKYHDGAAYYGMTQYPQPPPPTNLELGVPGIPAASSFYNPHLNPASGSRFPVPMNPADHLPSSSNYMGTAVPMDDYARNNISMDAMRNSVKRKNAEVVAGNVHYYNMSAGPNSGISPVPPLSFDGASVMDASYAAPEYRNNSALSISQDNGINRAGIAGLHRDPVWTHGYNHIMQGSSMGQPFQPPRPMWLETPSNSSGAVLPWNMTPMLPCFPVNNIHEGSLETANVGPPGYHEGAVHRGPANFLHSPPMVNQPHNLHPALCIQGVRFPVIYQPPVAAAPGGQPSTNAIQHTSLSSSPIAVEALPPASGFRMLSPFGRSALTEAVPRHRSGPHLNILPMDGVAIFEIPSVHEGSEEVDHHSDLRLDIDDMSYEELLSLSEQIGSVSTGLSEDDIAEHLKTRLYIPFSAVINLEELPPADQIVESCVICQDEYVEKERLGCLGCGHNYHEECLKKWLYLKNVCPICKSTALAVPQKDG